MADLDLNKLREAGWSVAVHNDYRLNGEPHTFWLWTHPSGRWIKGEGRTDEEALSECLAAYRSADAPSPDAGDGPKAQRKAPTDTCVDDATGKPILLGDRILYRREGKHTKPEYWNPEFEVVWDAPSFKLKHVGGGKPGDVPTDFILRHRNSDLIVLRRAAKGEAE